MPTITLINWSADHLTLERHPTESPDRVHLVYRGNTIGTLQKNWTVDWIEQWTVDLKYVGALGTVISDKKSPERDNAILMQAHALLRHWTNEQERIAYERKLLLGTLNRDSQKMRSHTVRAFIAQEIERLKDEHKHARKVTRRLVKRIGTGVSS